jgi:hypothetical protein
MRVHLGGDRGEEAAAREDAAFDVIEEAAGELSQPLEPPPRRAPPPGGAAGAPTTCSANRALAVSIVASWSSCFEPKCAKSPLLLIPTASASRPIESPAMPSTVASCAASRRIAFRLRSPSLRSLRARRAGSRPVECSSIA